MVQTIRIQTNHEILMERFHNKYFKGQIHIISKRSGVPGHTIRKWKYKINDPDLYLLICVCRAVASKNKLNFQSVILEAMDEIVNG